MVSNRTSQCACLSFKWGHNSSEATMMQMKNEEDCVERRWSISWICMVGKFFNPISWVFVFVFIQKMSHKNAFLLFPLKSSHKIGCFWTQSSEAAALPLCTDYLSAGLMLQLGLARGWPVSTSLSVQLPATLTHVCLLPGPWRHWVLQPVAYKTVKFTQVHNMVWRTLEIIPWAVG